MEEVGSVGGRGWTRSSPRGRKAPSSWPERVDLGNRPSYQELHSFVVTFEKAVRLRRDERVLRGYAYAVRFPQRRGDPMATGETGFDDVSFDLISVQYHSLKAGHDYGQYVRDAENAGRNDIADFFRSVMQQDSERAAQ